VYTTATPILRPLHRHERAPVLTVFRGLGDRSRRRRFLGPKPRLSARELETLTDVQRGRHEAIVATDPATGRAVAIARFVRDASDRSVAEVAFEVVDACQGLGVGRRLARELGLRARRAGFRRLRATVELGNEPAFALLRRLGTIEETRLDGDVVEVVVAL
jgi:RimJ/RimL family protein N-acetyltransferase